MGAVEKGPTLPPSFERVAREAFSAAFFTKANGWPRSQIAAKGEVVFDNAPAGMAADWGDSHFCRMDMDLILRNRDRREYRHNAKSRPKAASNGARSY